MNTIQIIVCTLSVLAIISFLCDFVVYARARAYYHYADIMYDALPLRDARPTFLIYFGKDAVDVCAKYDTDDGDSWVVCVKSFENDPEYPGFAQREAEELIEILEAK